MKHLKESLNQRAKFALISIRPNFANKILSGEKKLEFRRRWTTKPIEYLVIYSSSPVQRIVAVASIIGVTEGTETALWDLAKERKGGVTRKLIREYFADRETGFAIELGEILKFPERVNPRSKFPNFRPPQSFRYLDEDEYEWFINNCGIKLE